jgi:hypothetical protein
MAFCPSTKPVSFRPWWKAITSSSSDANGVLRRKPITGIAGCCAAGCWARAVSGQADAAPSRAMKARRLIR